MNKVEVREVISKKDLKKWVNFPNRLYKDNPNYVPFLFSDEVNTFNKKVNPSYDFCETKLFLAYQNNKIVGRIAGLINHAYNKKWNQNTIRFTRFDFVDDFDVSAALFNKVVEWGKQHNFTKIQGPNGFNDMDHEGMLIEGFDEFNMSITFYNAPYYIKHMEKLGLVKEVDWVEYLVKVPEKVDPKFERITSFLTRGNEFKLVTYSDKKSLKNDVYQAFKVIDEAFSKLFGTVPLTDRIINQVVSDYLPVINLDYVCTVKDKDNQILAVAILMPSMAKALKQHNGKLFPFGFINILKSLKGHNDILEMLFIAVKEEYQKQGIPAILINHLLKVFVKNGIKYCETGPELETNESVRSMWKGFETRQHKRRRCWQKEI